MNYHVVWEKMNGVVIGLSQSKGGNTAQALAPSAYQGQAFFRHHQSPFLK